MRTVSPATRLALALAGLSVTALCIAQAFGFLPDPRVEAIRERENLAAPIAVAISQAATRGQFDDVRLLIDAVVERNDDLLSAAVRRTDGSLLTRVGDHAGGWGEQIDARAAADASQVVVPIFDRADRWGRVELRFTPVSRSLLGFDVPPLVSAFVFVAACGFLMNFAFLSKMLAYMSPSQAVPKRVRGTLDVLAEGIVVLDEDGRIVMPNRAFLDLIDIDREALIGTPLSRLPWQDEGRPVADGDLPWKAALAAERPIIGASLQLRSTPSDAHPDGLITLLVNSTPLDSDDRTGRGVIASFDDITPLETKKRQLSDMLQTVRESTEEIRRQNVELERLATHDPLTGCVNRRRLFQIFEAEWKSSDRHGTPLACVMVDVDHFKAVNDEHGHSAGDTVLQRVAEALRGTARDSDIVSRYGGEEFCILLPHTDLAAGEQAAERFRLAVASVDMPGIGVTASFGLSEVSLGAESPQLLIDQADQALYAAKDAGRNRVLRFDEIDPNAVAAESSRPKLFAAEEASPQNIPFNAVTALISALAYRDQETAAHCRRVADLAVATAEGLMGTTACYTLEIASLLHDLGKIGVPDHILLKPGELTPEEWQVMRQHDRIGVEIVRASFAYDPLTQIVSQYRRDYAESADQSLGARILKIADAYDAMTSDRPYRKGRRPAEALAELRRCAGKQFDPELVERFATAVRHSAADSGGVNVAKETALSIGLQIENLASALDDKDLERLGALASRLRQVAERYDVPQIAERADGLAKAVRADDNDLIGVLQSATDLLRLCRSTQHSYIADAGKA